MKKLNNWLCKYHWKKYLKYFKNTVGAKKYLKEKTELSSLYGLSVYADTDSFAEYMTPPIK